MLEELYSIKPFDPPAYVKLVHDHENVQRGFGRTHTKSAHHHLWDLLFINTRLINMFRQGKTDDHENQVRVARDMAKLLRAVRASDDKDVDSNMLDIHIIMDRYDKTYLTVKDSTHFDS